MASKTPIGAGRQLDKTGAAAKATGASWAVIGRAAGKCRQRTHERCVDKQSNLALREEPWHAVPAIVMARPASASPRVSVMPPESTVDEQCGDEQAAKNDGRGPGCNPWRAGPTGEHRSQASGE